MGRAARVGEAPVAGHIPSGPADELRKKGAAIMASRSSCDQTVVHVQSPFERPFWRTVVTGTQAMIAAEHPLEAMAAQKTLQAGRNAIDAAVAAFYMTTVVEHHQAVQAANRDDDAVMRRRR